MNIMKIVGIMCLVVLSFSIASYANKMTDERAPSVEELKKSINLKDLTCVFNHKRWEYSEGEKVNGKDLLATSIHQLNNMNPTIQCMHDETCYFTCFDKNNEPYSGNAFATNDMGNIILMRPLKDGLPTDGVIKNYDSMGRLDLEIYVKNGEIVRYDTVYEGIFAKHVRDEDKHNIWHFQHFYSNGRLEAELTFDMDNNKVIEKTLYKEDGSRVGAD